MTHYTTLGVHAAAAPDEVAAAARAKAREHHPDRGGSHDAMAAVNAARVVLLDPAETKRYRAKLLATTHRACMHCQGNGGWWKQKGFKGRVFNGCTTCYGSGMMTR